MEDSQLIEAYFSDELDAEELTSFEARLKTDLRFAQEVESYQLIIEEIKHEAEEKAMKAKLSEWDQELDQESSTRTVSMRFASWKVAAVFVPFMAIAGLTYYVINRQVTQDHLELYGSYFKPYEDVISTRSGETRSGGVQSGSTMSRGTENMAKAMSSYNEGNYQQAISLFEIISVKEKDKERATAALLYAGIAYMAVDSLTQAVDLLQHVKAQEYPLFKEVADWYLLLSHLKTNQIDDFNHQLSVILSQKEHLYFEEATRLNNEWDRDK
ncbi:MAG: hypothetical protein AAGA66_20890 [Bacteroidota bacterium]